MKIDVLVEVNVGTQDQTFTYLVPSELELKIEIGKRVKVPFGNRKLEGFIVAINNQPQDYQLKEIISVIDEQKVLTPEMFALGKYMSNITLAPLIHCYQTMLPTALKANRNTNIKIKTKTYLSLNKSKEDVLSYIESIKSKIQKDILNLFLDKDLIAKSDIIKKASLKILIEKGLLKELYQEEYRLPEAFKNSNQVNLTVDQLKVIEDFQIGTKDIYLLYGVTGSGKTEVYMNIIDRCLEEKKQAIVLVPEIALTMQLVNRFQNHFGNKVAILHSRLSDGEKYDEWRRIERGEAEIVIGPRSAVFAPLKDIGVIIIDEEHENSYKQENSPRYHAHDIAFYLGKKHHAKVLLGSATPSLESYTKAKVGIYGFLELKTRVNNHQLPQVKIVDMKESMRQGYRILSKELITAIKDKLNKKEQIMILLNRRGYSNYLNCQSCGHTFKCPACDITMTYHKTSDMMRCHYCGYATKKIDVCPECKTKSLRSIGFGTEKLEEELKKLFEDAKIIRMDLDTTTQKGSHSKIINAFSNREYDILLGTQMIAKGLDFDNVSLVGVINADNSLDIPDFRSGEKTFQLLSQVAGRSGRTSLKGEVILQVFNSDHYVISTVKEHNYEAFYRQEIIMRKKLNYPPFCFIASIKIISKEYEKGFKLSKEISDFLKKELPNNNVLGPTMANIFKINNYYRYNCLIKYKNKEEVLETLKKVQNHYQTNQNFKIEFDFNPIHF